MNERSPIVHARVLRFDGHAYSPGWVGKRVHRDTVDSSGAIVFPCGARLDVVHAAAVEANPTDTYWHMPWAVLKSKRSREAALVTCPACLERIRAAGFVYAGKAVAS